MAQKEQWKVDWLEKALRKPAGVRIGWNVSEWVADRSENATVRRNSPGDGRA